MPNRKTSFSMKNVDSAIRVVEQGAEMLERGAKAAARVNSVVSRGKAAGAKRAMGKSNPMRGPGLSPLAPSGAPVSVSHPQGPTYHTVTKSTPEVTSVRGRAFLGNVQSTGVSYNIVGGTYSLNPVLLNDRLSVMATTFDKYVYKRVKVCYVPFAATSQTGQIYMYLDRDYLDPLADPSQVGQIMSAYNAISDQPWKNMSTALVRDPTEKRTYFTLLNQAQLPETEQFRVNVYVTGNGYTGIIGQLYLEYDLDLVAPVYAPLEFAPLTNFSNAPAATGTGGLVVMQAGSHSVSCNATGSFPFGIPTTDDARVWEVVLADVGQAGPYTTPNVTWGSPAGPAFQQSNGQTLYVVRSAYTGLDTTNYFNIFQSYQDAMSGDASQSLWNSNTVTQPIVGESVVCKVRKISNTMIASFP